MKNFCKFIRTCPFLYYYYNDKKQIFYDNYLFIRTKKGYVNDIVPDFLNFVDHILGKKNLELTYNNVSRNGVVKINATLRKMSDLYPFKIDKMSILFTIKIYYDNGKYEKAVLNSTEFVYDFFNWENIYNFFVTYKPSCYF